MATKLKPVDVVVVGVGLSGTILAKELAEAGLSVVGLERGRWRNTDPDFGMPHAHDELRYVKRHELMQDLSRETLTFRNNTNGSSKISCANSKATWCLSWLIRFFSSSHSKMSSAMATNYFYDDTHMCTHRQDFCLY